MNHLKLIKTQLDHQQALSRLLALLNMSPPSGSVEGDEIEVLSLLIEKYEMEHFPIDQPEPLEAIRFRMEQQGLTNKDLIPFIGSAPKVSEVLSGKRPLSMNMVRKLCFGLGIPAEILIGNADHSNQTVLQRS